MCEVPSCPADRARPRPARAAMLVTAGGEAVGSVSGGDVVTPSVTMFDDADSALRMHWRTE